MKKSLSLTLAAFIFLPVVCKPQSNQGQSSQSASKKPPAKAPAKQYPRKLTDQQLDQWCEINSALIVRAAYTLTEFIDSPSASKNAVAGGDLKNAAGILWGELVQTEEAVCTSFRQDHPKNISNQQILDLTARCANEVFMSDPAKPPIDMAKVPKGHEINSPLSCAALGRKFGLVFK